jgi:hypothetical protein
MLESKTSKLFDNEKVKHGQGSILSFFGNTNGPTHQKTAKSYDY